MTLEDRTFQHGVPIVPDKFAAPNAAYEMSSRDYVVRPSADGDSGAYILTLPPVAEARGRFYSVVCRNADAVNAITVEDNNDDSECWEGDFTLNGKCDSYLFYSDGMKWHVCNSITTYAGTSAAPTTSAATTAAPQ